MTTFPSHDGDDFETTEDAANYASLLCTGALCKAPHTDDKQRLFRPMTDFQQEFNKIGFPPIFGSASTSGNPKPTNVGRSDDSGYWRRKLYNLDFNLFSSFL